MRHLQLMSKGFRLLLRPGLSYPGCYASSAEVSSFNGGKMEVVIPAAKIQMSSFSLFTGSGGAGPCYFTQPMLAASTMEQEGSVVKENVEAATHSSSEVQRIHGEMVAAMKQLVMPPTKKLSQLLRECSTAEDVKLALDLLTELRSFRGSQCKQTQNFTEYVSELLVQSCIRAKAPEYALRVLWRHNVYGLTPTLNVAHELLGYAKEQGDVPLMQQILKTMVLNGIRPTTKTADVAIRLCKEKGDLSYMVNLAKEFHANGIELHPSVYDVCISSVANAGNAQKVHEIQQWRHKAGLAQTTASAFALAKAYVMKKKPKKAASVIFNQCKDQDKAKCDKYLDMMLRSWPLELSSKPRKRTKEQFLADMKKTTTYMIDELARLGHKTDIDVDEAFGAGKSLENDGQAPEIIHQHAAFA